MFFNTNLVGQIHFLSLLWSWFVKNTILMPHVPLVPLWLKYCNFTFLMPHVVEVCNLPIVLWLLYLRKVERGFYFHANSQLRGVCYPRLRDFFNIVDLVQWKGVLFHPQTVLSHCWSAQEMAETHIQTDRLTGLNVIML